MRPALLISSIARRAPFSLSLPRWAIAPVSGPTWPILTVASWARAEPPAVSNAMAAASGRSFAANLYCMSDLRGGRNANIAGAILPSYTVRLSNRIEQSGITLCKANAVARAWCQFVGPRGSCTMARTEKMRDPRAPARLGRRARGAGDADSGQYLRTKGSGISRSLETQTLLVSRYSLTASMPPSRPRPLSL